jgi:nitronate monooxygenase
MNLPRIIQGGMGVAISNWTLANAVSQQGYLGVVSGTGLAHLMIARLMDGDSGGHVRRALGHFPFQAAAKRILESYFVDKPSVPKPPYKRPPMWSLKPPRTLEELTVISSFVEVFLAKERHSNPVGFNLLEKIQMPTMASLYGAMLAKVNVVIMGAGIPLQIPGIMDELAQHQAVSYKLDVEGAGKEDDYQLHFDPLNIFPEATEKLGSLLRPYFLPIISSVVLAKALIKRATGKVDGFIVEAPVAGGHNAPPRGPMHLDDEGQPIYGEKDEVDLASLKELGLPFWLAGGFDTHEKLEQALAVGANGVQVGTAFGYCDESGMEAGLKRRIIQTVLDHHAKVHTSPTVSPTGYPFKVVQLEGSLSDPDIYDARPRLCDIGLLRQAYHQEDGTIAFRCASEPVEQYIAKGGALEDTIGRTCLCNNLMATAGFAQHRKDGYLEPAIATAGDNLLSIGKYIKPGQTSYSVKDVLEVLIGKD